MGQDMYVSDRGVPEDAITEVHIISQALVVDLQIRAIDHVVDEWPRLPRTIIVKIWRGSHPIGFEQHRHAVSDTPFAVDGIISSGPQKKRFSYERCDEVERTLIWRFPFKFSCFLYS